MANIQSPIHNSATTVPDDVCFPSIQKDYASEPIGLPPKYQDRWPSNLNNLSCKDHRQVSVCMESAFHRINSLMLHRKNRHPSQIHVLCKRIPDLFQTCQEIFRPQKIVVFIFCCSTTIFSAIFASSVLSPSLPFLLPQLMPTPFHLPP